MSKRRRRGKPAAAPARGDAKRAPDRTRPHCDGDAGPQAVRAGENVAEAARPPLQWMLATVVFMLGLYFVHAQPVDMGGPEARLSPPDESAHVAYLEELCATRRLPVFRSGHGNYEAHQPPLYYLLAAPLYAAAAPLGKRAAVLALRTLNCAVAAATVLVLWELAALLFPTQVAGRVLTTLIAALWPARLAAVAAVSNDALSELAATAALLALARLAARELRAERAFIAGLWVGIAMLVKSSTLPLLAVGMAAVYVAWKREGKPEVDFVKAAGAMLAGFALVWGWWGVRNTMLYGDPLAARAFQRIFKQDRATPEFFISRGLTGTQYYMLVLWQTAKSFWGVLGQANVYMPRGFYWLGALWWAAATGLAVAKVFAARTAPEQADSQTGGPAGAAKRKRKGAERVESGSGEQSFSVAALWGLLALHLVLTGALFLRFNAVFYQAQARYFLPASAAVGAFLAWPWVWPRRPVISVVGGMWFAAMAVAVAVLDAAGLAQVAGGTAARLRGCHLAHAVCQWRR